MGKAVYCEKPLTHDIAEARNCAPGTRIQGPTQMGNQGHCEDGYRRLCEFVWAGVVAHHRDHSWTDRANAAPDRALPPCRARGPELDSWIGPPPSAITTRLNPHDWHDWYDFGNGSIGNMGCHVLDGVFGHSR